MGVAGLNEGSRTEALTQPGRVARRAVVVSRIYRDGNSLVVQCLGLGAFTFTAGLGSFPGWGTTIPQAM